MGNQLSDPIEFNVSSGNYTKNFSVNIVDKDIVVDVAKKTSFQKECERRSAKKHREHARTIDRVIERLEIFLEQKLGPTDVILRYDIGGADESRQNQCVPFSFHTTSQEKLQVEITHNFRVMSNGKLYLEDFMGLDEQVKQLVIRTNEPREERREKQR